LGGILTVTTGYDPAYPWRQIGTAEPGTTKSGDRGGAYYLSPAEKGGEPPGGWTGRAVADLGFRLESTVERAPFERLYGQFLDPRDASGQTHLGRPPRQYQDAEQIYQAMAAAEPEATAERRAQLRIEAKTQARAAVYFFDATFSVSKSISLLHASALANAVQAAEQGDLEGAAYWQDAAEQVWAAIAAGDAAAMTYLQDEAGYTRAGYHGRRVDGVETGRWEDAHRWVIASFPQHTSRDGDPQLHIHNLILNRVERETDSEWRTLDSKALFRERAAASAIAALVMENELSREFGIEWVQRKDGHGREIKGVSKALMDVFSSRRRSIDPLTADLAQAYEAQHGRSPDARALGELRQWATHATRRAKEASMPDRAELVRQWEAQASAKEAGALAPVMPQTTNRRAPGASPQGAASADARGAGAAPGAAPHQPDPQAHTEAPPFHPDQARRLMQMALASCQGAQSTWTKADLIRHLGENLPATAATIDTADAVTLLPDLADQVLAGAAGDVITLEAPEWPQVPKVLRRADGRSLYTPHGAARYATQAQLTLEERLEKEAQARGAPHMAPEAAAQVLGADQVQLQAQLRAENFSAVQAQERTGAGLRLDQAAAAFLMLTSDRRVEVMVGPAGSGKTRTVAEVARAWQQASKGDVVGLTTSQAARNVLAQEGVTKAWNTADFLGHLEEAREARGPRYFRPYSLVIIDEASMMSTADLTAIIGLAAERHCKVLMTGDHEQLTAVEGGGGMLMLARTLGYVQLAEPVRFRESWERDATLRLRAGDATVLAEYEEHARLRGGTPEEAMEQAYRGWLADHLAGKDALLMARTTDQARELSRRARGDLVRYGRVAADGEVALRDDAVASAGDLIMARKNDRQTMAGERGRWLTNRDVLEVMNTEAGTEGDHVYVRRLRGRDARTGEPRWSQPFLLAKAYLKDHCDLAYATTCHAAQGRTVDTAHVLVDWLTDRQGLYVAMSRGRYANYAYCVTDYPRAAQTQEGARPAPELQRAKRLAREDAGLSCEPELGADPDAPKLDPVAVMAAALERDGSKLSAVETLRAELSRADHLGVLGAIWHDLARQAQTRRFERTLTDALPERLAKKALNDKATTWLWRTLREAEAAGLDGTRLLQWAADSGSLDDAIHPARVLNYRARRALAGRESQLPGSWADRVPVTGDTDLDRYMRELAEAMDERIRRLGEHAVETTPLWARQALGPVPSDPVDRAAWEERASKIAAYREMYGYAHPGDAIGPAPGRTSPEARAAWHAAQAAVGATDGIDVRGLSDGDLWLRRGTYERETTWAPPHVSEQLRLARMAERDAAVKAIRATHDARAAASEETANRHNQLAGIWQAMQAKASQVAGILAEAQETRREWEAVTEPTRRIALAADAELRRRYPDADIEPLRPHPAEAAGVIPEPQPEPEATREDVWVQPTLDGAVHLPDQRHARASRLGKMPEQAPQAAGQLALGLTPETVHDEIPAQVRRIRASAQRAQEKLDYLRGLPERGTEEGELAPGDSWAVLAGCERDAVLQPPKPEVVPASKILERLEAEAVPAEPERA
jgi:hypothetical protein